MTAPHSSMQCHQHQSLLQTLPGQSHPGLCLGIWRNHSLYGIKAQRRRVFCRGECSNGQQSKSRSGVHWGGGTEASGIGSRRRELWPRKGREPGGLARRRREVLPEDTHPSWVACVAEGQFDAVPIGAGRRGWQRLLPKGLYVRLQDTAFANPKFMPMVLL
jgi:hypothetical protein